MEKILFKIIRAAVRAISPQLRVVLKSALDKLAEAAKGTPNEWDDLLVEVLAVILDGED